MPTNKTRPIHPGEILREEFLVPLDLSPHALAMELHVPAPRINDIVRERRAVTPTRPCVLHAISTRLPSSGSTCKADLISRSYKTNLAKESARKYVP